MPGKSIEEILRRAMEEGKFDDLPGRGKPLNLDENPLTDPEWRAAHRILKSSGYSLPWIETRREIDAAFEAALALLRRAWAWRQENQVSHGNVDWVEAEWERAQAAFREEAAALNRRIRDYNLEVPATGFQRSLVDAEREIDRVTRGIDA